MIQLNITEDQFFDTFNLEANHLNPEGPWDGCMFETYGEELEYVNIQTPGCIWTILDCDGTLVLQSGDHFVNRFGYLITQEELPEGIIIQVEVDQ